MVEAAKSHIMTKELMLKWFRDIVCCPAMPSKLMLLVDSWTSFRDQASIQATVPAGEELILKRIPPGATSQIQPLDVHFFRLFKSFVKKLTAHVIASKIDFQVSQRDSILKMISQIYHQFRAPRFVSCMLEAWKSAHYIDDVLPHYVTPATFCCPGDLIGACNKINCDNMPYIRCAYCLNIFCFLHFVESFHRC